MNTVSLRFNGHFQGEPGLAGVYWSKGSWRRWTGGDNRTTGAISHAKLQSNHHLQQTNIQFLQAQCPSCHPTNSVKALKGKYHIPWTCLYPKLTWGSSNFVWPLIASGYLGGCHASHQPSDASTPTTNTVSHVKLSSMISVMKEWMKISYTVCVYVMVYVLPCYFAFNRIAAAMHFCIISGLNAVFQVVK